MEYRFTTENFEAEVLQSNLPVLVDLYADWCGPCKQMAPIVEEIATEYDGRLKVGKCNIDEDMQIAQKYRVQNIPTFLLFKGGEVADMMVGANPDALYDKIDELLG